VFTFLKAKSKKVFFIYYLIFLLFLLSLPAVSFSSQAKKELNQALSYYADEAYPEALSRFESLAQNFPQDSHFSIFKLMIAKCHFNLQNFPQAEKSFKSYLKEFPQSRFLPLCHFYLGNLKYLNGELISSASEFIQAFEEGEEETKKLAFESLLLLLRDYLDQAQLEKLAKETRHKKIHSEILFWWGKKELDRGNYSRAEGIFQDYLKLYPNGERVNQVNLYSQNVSRLFEEVIGVGVLAPISGPYSEYGESMVRGTKLAMRDSDKKVKLFIRDTQGNPVQATLAARSLIEEDKVSVILGALRSECTVGASATAQNSRIPLITPTSNQEGIADLGDFIFQFSPSTQKIGERLAQFAINELKIKKIVILSPDDSYGENATLGFENKAREYKVKVMAREVYTPGSTDFSLQLKKIREILWNEKMEKEGGFDSTKYLDRFGEPIPQSDIPVEVDGFFLPIYPNDVALIAPQIAFFKIQTRLLGTEGWGQREILDLSRQFTSGVIFASNFSRAENSFSVNEFINDFELSYKKAPDKVAFLSYDATRLVLSSLKGASTPESIKDNLLRIKRFRGISGEIDFAPNGENTNIGIHIYQDGEIKRLE
jgi:branched-chain amino acid transport system substrate-binding protein